MKTILDWIRENGDYSNELIKGYKEPCVPVKIKLVTFNGFPAVELHVDDEILVSTFMTLETAGYETESDLQNWIQEVLEGYGLEVRFCEECGCLMQAGHLEEGGWWYACEDCFESGMDRRFGKGMWRSTENEEEPYYEYWDGEEWIGVDIFTQNGFKEE